MLILFDFDDGPYIKWIASNPNGYVINTRRENDPTYMVLHTATCKHISNYHSMCKPGAFTERTFIKICSDNINELSTWVRNHGRGDGSFSKECSHCNQ